MINSNNENIFQKNYIYYIFIIIAFILQCFCWNQHSYIKKIFLSLIKNIYLKCYDKLFRLNNIYLFTRKLFN